MEQHDRGVVSDAWIFGIFSNWSGQKKKYPTSPDEVFGMKARPQTADEMFQTLSQFAERHNAAIRAKGT